MTVVIVPFYFILKNFGMVNVKFVKVCLLKYMYKKVIQAFTKTIKLEYMNGVYCYVYETPLSWPAEDESCRS